MAPRRSNRRRGRRAGKAVVARWFEYHTVTLTTGASSWVARQNLEVHLDRAFKVIGTRYIFVADGPALCQVRGYERHLPSPKTVLSL